MQSARRSSSDGPSPSRAICSPSPSVWTPKPGWGRAPRLTPGADLALRDELRTPVQLGGADPIARDLSPLAERLDTEAWMGARPCTPDMLPVIGPAPRHENLFFAFGHAHHGLTLGAVTGRLVAEMMTGEAPFVDPAPYSPVRFT